MRILVEQSGYELANLGDIAMLVAAVDRLRGMWPDAEVAVVAASRHRLQAYEPTARLVPPAPLTVDPDGPGPARASALVRRAYRTAAPLAAARFPATAAVWGAPLCEVRHADLVVSSGGGFVSDTWAWHAGGVLGTLAYAQRLGKVTAMLGQGLGPLTRPRLRRLAAEVLPGLAVLGLREGLSGPRVATGLGVAPGRQHVTGDDGLALAAGAPARQGMAVGVNVRATRYAGVDAAVLGDLAGALDRAVRELDAVATALPVSVYRSDDELAAIAGLLRHLPAGRVVAEPLHRLDDLVAAVAGCRVVVTGSYHAGVFALAQGIPVIGLTNSPYYDGKFAGLAAQFPAGACTVTEMSGPGWPERLTEAVVSTWARADTLRAPTMAAAHEQIAAQERTYGLVQAAVEGTENGSFA